ncbi:MAG TPA: glycoside hydrolase family 127 protein, partial [Saprospiraceae bacterium]|nr:glycoside hydrolase family 127 protein [Saprospiraceae bacterium]
FPKQNHSDILIFTKRPKLFIVNLRKPKWATDYTVLINGVPFLDYSINHDGYLSIERKWRNKDKISIQFKTSTTLERLPDGSNWAAFVNGPIILAAKTSEQDLDGLFADDSRMGHEAKGKLYPMSEAHALVSDEDFSLKIRNLDLEKYQLDSLVLQPFYTLHDSRYQMYFPLYNTQEFLRKQNDLKLKEDSLLALDKITIDNINCGEQQPETDHSFKGEKTNSGYEDEMFWRNTSGYISYTLTDVKMEAQRLLMST